jgi:tetratricopeptide (TPR) repeat protein
MEPIRFFSWEIMKVLGVALLGLVGAKSIRALRSSRKEGVQSGTARRDTAGKLKTRPGIKNLPWTLVALYSVLLALVSLGARGIGNEIAAEVYFMASRDNLAHSQPGKAYTNALRAVELRSAEVKYWQMLSTCKFALRQYESVLEDRHALESLEGGHLSEQDAMRFAFAYYSLARYDQAKALTRQLIRENRFYTAPYVLLGMTLMAQKNYAGAERVFLEVLQMNPTQEGAVEGLAHVYFLLGEPARALAVLNETAKFQFNPGARARFEQLKALYEHEQIQNASDQSRQELRGRHDIREPLASRKRLHDP